MNYDDIINSERPISKYPKMSIEKRAGQFHPFSALSGYDESITEASKFLEEKQILDENTMEKLDNMLHILQKNIQNHPRITLTYFCNDFNKTGGTVKKICGEVRKINSVFCYLELQNGIKVCFKDILDISWETICM